MWDCSPQGERGLPGERGPAGLKGLEGSVGDQGRKGDPGAKGQAVSTTTAHIAPNPPDRNFNLCGLHI